MASDPINSMDSAAAFLGLTRCEFDDACDFCSHPENGSWVALTHISEDVTEADYYICGRCAILKAEVERLRAELYAERERCLDWKDVAKTQRGRAERAEAACARKNLAIEAALVAHKEGRGLTDDEEGFLVFAEQDDAGRAYAERMERLEREVEVLRQYGNKDCTAMADAALQEPSDERSD